MAYHEMTIFTHLVGFGYDYCALLSVDKFHKSQYLDIFFAKLTGWRLIDFGYTLVPVKLFFLEDILAWLAIPKKIGFNECESCGI